MRWCNRCNCVTVSGVHYEYGQHRRYSECPKCHERVDYKIENNEKIKVKQ